MHSGIEFEEHDDSREVYGIKFWHDGFVYDVHCNLHLGERIFINKDPSDGFVQDMPFHLGTALFLPDQVVVTLR